MSEAHNIEVDDRLTLDQLVKLHAAQLPTTNDRTSADIALIHIDQPSIRVIEEVRG